MRRIGQAPRFRSARTAIVRALGLFFPDPRPTPVGPSTAEWRAACLKVLEEPYVAAILAGAGDPHIAMSEFAAHLFAAGVRRGAGGQRPLVLPAPVGIAVPAAPPPWSPSPARPDALDALRAALRVDPYGIDDSLPPPHPPAVLLPDGSWASAADGRPVPVDRVATSLVDGYLAERSAVDRHSRALRDLGRAVHGHPSHAAGAALAAIEARVSRMRTFVDLSDHWRRRRQGAGRPSLGDGSDMPSLSGDGLDWWRSALDEGVVTDQAVAAAGVAVVASRAQPGIPIASPVTPAMPLPSVGGEPDPARSSSRVLTQREAVRLFGPGAHAPGSAAEAGMPLPVGSVIVLAGPTPPYLRGRGWRIGPDRRLFAWDWRGEARPLPVGGADGPGRDPDGRRNRSAVPVQGFLHHGGHRWWNLDGGGWLADETEAEWEDRRDRARSSATAAIRDGSMTPGRWRWLVWTLVGHHGAGGDGVSSPVPAMGDALGFSAAPSSMPGEWADPLSHARRWGGVLPDALRSHPLHAALSSMPRPTGDAPDYWPAWRAALGASPGVADPAFRRFAAAALGGMGYDGFAAAARAADATRSRSLAIAAEAVAAHRDWMSRRAQLVLVTATGSLERVPWAHDAFPEPFLPPACMDIPLSDAAAGVDFAAVREAPVPGWLPPFAAATADGAPVVAQPERHDLLPPGDALLREAATLMLGSP